MMPRAAVCADRIVEVLDTESSVEPPAAPVAPARADGHLELRDVAFRYPGAEPRRCCATSPSRARAGQTTAIIGSTGAGKTTLMSLVPRLFDATARRRAGRRRGRPRPSTPTTCGRRIGLVPQRPYLFSGTVASNLRYGNPDATDEELWAALEVAQARDFVRHMPGGLDGADRPGRHERLRRPAAAAGHRPRPGPPSPRSTCSTTRSPRSTWPPTPALRAALRAGHRGRHRGHRRPAGVHDRRRRPDPRARRRRGSSGRARTRSCWRPARPTPRSSSPSWPRRRRRMSAPTRHVDRGPGRRHRPAARPMAARAAAAARLGRRRAAGGEGGGLRPVGRAGCVGMLRPERARSSRLVLVLGVISVALNVIGPEDPRQGHRPDLRGCHRQAAARGHHRRAGRGVGAGAGNATVRRPARAAATSCPASGIDFAALGHVLLIVIGLYVGAAVFGYLQGYLLNGIVQRTVYDLRARRRGQAQPAAAVLLRRQAARRGALSRVTNDIDNVSSQTSSRR